jgi:hypothetical protein
MHFKNDELSYLKGLLHLDISQQLKEILEKHPPSTFIKFMKFLRNTVKRELIYMEIPGEDGRK